LRRKGVYLFFFDKTEGSIPILYIKKTTPFSILGLDFSFQKHPQFSTQITHVTN